jgi:hypothetical protein
MKKNWLGKPSEQRPGDTLASFAKDQVGANSQSAEEIKRRSVIMEIYETEKRYVRSLQLLCDVSPFASRQFFVQA